MDWTQMMKEQIRSGTGEITSGGLAGKPHLILTSTGARTGEPREAILSFVREGEKYVVAGTFGGSPTDPAWTRNLVANPEVKVEAKAQTFTARAQRVTDEATYQRLWEALVESRPDFAEYPAKSGRKIPIFTLEPTTGE
jgi:deazaflavin-dependent oxidoreductase (nitroreductase family)